VISSRDGAYYAAVTLAEYTITTGGNYNEN
jgi:hypothetical protein